MFDGIKILDLSVSADALLSNTRLLFPLPVDEQTGAVLDRPRRATDRGLTFTLTPTKAGGRLRCELQGSLHRFGRGGLHNADDFTATDLMAVLNELVTAYGIDPFLSRLNNVEFGVNVRLPFPVSLVLDNLISYKNRPFVRVREPGNGYAYYQALTQRYVIKLYDKGDQYNLPGNMLRVEVKVLKMEYLTRQRVQLDTLADLLTVTNYGALLVETFGQILFDDPTINPAILTTRERDIYQNGRNPKFWQVPDKLTSKEYERSRKALQRAETMFRALLDKHRVGTDWQSETAVLIGQTWQRLTTVNDDLLTTLDTFPPEKCPKLTGSDSDLVTGEMSQINPLYVVLIWDNEGSQQTDPNAARETPTDIADNIGESIVFKGSHAAALSPSSVCQNVGRAVRPTASVLRADADLLAEVEQNRKRYAKGSKEDDVKRAAHNLRNDDSNPRNNLARRLRRLLNAPTLFALSEIIRLTPDQRAALDHWQGTRYEIRF